MVEFDETGAQFDRDRWVEEKMQRLPVVVETQRDVRNLKRLLQEAYENGFWKGLAVGNAQPRRKPSIRRMRK